MTNEEHKKFKREYERFQAQLFGETMFVVPDNEEGCNEGYPGGILPGHYTMNQLVEMLRMYKDNPEVIEFIADMLEV